MRFIGRLFVFLCILFISLSNANGTSDTLSLEKSSIDVSKLTYFVHQDDTGGCGSAFLLEDTNGVWLVSNVHVFSGSTNLTIINVDGTILDVPSQVEIAKDRDIIRFRTDQPKGLRLSPSCEFEEAIFAYGDSGGAGVLTKLEGKAIALGPDRIEISAEIIPGNSGGPVVNSDSEVVGVSSYLFRHDDLPDWIADGTRFTDTRRMAIRLNKVEWIPADFSEFYRETVALKELEDALYTAIFITVVLSDNISHTMTVSTDHRGFQSWVRKHNRYAEKGSQNGIKSNIRRLPKILERIEGNPTPDCEITIPFLKDKLKDMQNACAATREQVEQLSD